MKFKDLFRFPLRAGTLSLKTVLAIYFIPISVLPALFVSFYANHLFEDSMKETLERRASSERDAIVAEVDSFETELVTVARAHAAQSQLIRALFSRNIPGLDSLLQSLKSPHQIRLYSPEGAFFTGLKGEESRERISYLSKEGLRRVKAKGETVDRYFDEESGGLVTIIRILVKTQDRFVGVLEEEAHFSPKKLAELKNRRGVDVVFLNREFTSVAASFALSTELVKNFSSVAFEQTVQGKKDPLYVNLGDDARFAAFLYDFPAGMGKQKKWGYLALFISMTSVDVTLGKLKFTIIYLTAFLIFVAAFLIFVFSNRLVKPIASLVLAMKRIKIGRVEQIPSIDSTYEIEYLVRSFNEMVRNVNAAKRALEIKLEELHRANQEIKNTQSTLVQSAKMISLGQIVAGVAHELNNPIAFIYSNMHHLLDYVDKVQRLVEAQRKIYPLLKSEERERMLALEKELEIDHILKDMQELTKSCVEGANRTKEIVLGLRTFSRVEESDFRMANLIDGLRSTIKLLVSEFKGKVTLHEEYQEIPLVECNLSQMNQVFMNLLSNAAHAIQSRGDIWVRVSATEATVKIEIEDSGCGIAKEALEKVFDPFFTTKKVGQGTGLGLSIAYGLIQKHHGTIDVMSELGRGTKFTIVLPLLQPQTNTAA